MALVTSFAMWVRGAVVAGPYIVYPKCWWRREDRRTARKAAKLLRYVEPKIREKVRQRIRDEAAYGFAVTELFGEPPDGPWN